MKTLNFALIRPVIQFFEQGPAGGPALTPYQDPAGYWTIGYGHRCASSVGPITADQANQIAQNDLQAFAAFVNQCLGPAADRLSDGQFAALVDFCFNLGDDAFQHSTLHAVVMSGQYPLVPGQLEKWVYGHVNGQAVELQGLVKRRAAEVDLWNNGVWSGPN